MSDQVFCYVGKCACGATRAATVDLPRFKKETAEFVAELINDGLKVERVTVEDARASFGKCSCVSA